MAREVTIETLVAGGRGLARPDGPVWLVDGALPGERVLAEPIRVRRGLVEATTLEILQRGPERVDPPCPYQGICGGCPWMVLSIDAQREWKRRLTIEGLARIGGVRDADVLPTMSSPLSFGYRNKVEFALTATADGPVVGLHAARSHAAIVDIRRCLLQDEAANALLGSVREFFSIDPGRSDPILRAGAAGSARIAIRRSQATGRMLVAIQSDDRPFPSADSLAQMLFDRHPEVSGVARLIAPSARRGGIRSSCVQGVDRLDEILGGIRFRLPAAAFVQVNPLAAERLLEAVAEWAGDVAREPVLDLYGGVGVLGLSLARRGAEVTVVEADASAVSCGREAAREEGLRVRFVRAGVAGFLRSRPREPRRPSLVVADPPRSGLARDVLHDLVAQGPDRILLVSCDPATLARDVSRLRSRGYALRRARPFDLFPQTPHVEVLTELVRI